MLEFIRLLAIGYEEVGYDDLSKPPKEQADKNPEFQKWVNDKYQVEIPLFGNEIVEQAIAVHENFETWVANGTIRGWLTKECSLNHIGGTSLIYTIERANLLAEQFNRFKSTHAHHLAGLYANIDFWLGEVESAFRTIDQYNARFSALRDAQQTWVEIYNTKAYPYCPMCDGRCEFDDGTPEPPRQTASSELKTARLRLKEAARAFLLRCYRTGLVDEAGLKELFSRLGTSVEPSDLD